MQPNTVSTPHDTDPPDPAPVPDGLLEAVARALAAALIPPPRRPPPPETDQAADFLTAAQLARRLGVTGRSWPPRRPGPRRRAAARPACPARR